MTVDYRVRLDAFEGPLDLLLYLIRRAEVDITDIPIAKIADQYTAYLAEIDRIDIDLAGEFLVVAATLMEIKSRMIQPAPEGGATLGLAEGETPAPAGEDPRAELVRQLLAYKKFRDASQVLELKKETWERRFPAGRAGVDGESLREALAAAEGDLDLDDVSLVDLADAFARISAAVNFDRLGEHVITDDDTPIELHAADILDRLRTEGSPGLALGSIFTGRTRGEMLGLFIATLELVRRRAIAVSQETPGGPILLALRPDEPAPEAASPERAEPPEIVIPPAAPASPTPQ